MLDISLLFQNRMLPMLGQIQNDDKKEKFTLEQYANASRPAPFQWNLLEVLGKISGVKLHQLKVGKRFHSCKEMLEISVLIILTIFYPFAEISAHFADIFVTLLLKHVWFSASGNVWSRLQRLRAGSASHRCQEDESTQGCYQSKATCEIQRLVFFIFRWLKEKWYFPELSTIRISSNITASKCIRCLFFFF